MSYNALYTGRNVYGLFTIYYEAMQCKESLWFVPTPSAFVTLKFTLTVSMGLFLSLIEFV